MSAESVELLGPRRLMLRADLAPIRASEGERLDDHALTSILADWVATCGLAGQRAIIVQDSTTGGSGAIACPRSIGEPAALQAGLMALAEWGVEAADAPRGAVIAATDRGGESAQHYVVASWQDNNACQRVCAAVERAGLRVAWTANASALLLAAAHRRAIELSQRAPVVLLHVGARSSVLCAASAGRVLLSREAGLGVEALIDALVHLPDNQIQPRAEVRARLFADGVPAVDAEGAAEGNVRALLAALQPVLQRWGVELRQSLRFALETESRSTTLLAVEGYGAAVPGLATYLARRVELALTPPREGAAEPVCDATVGAVACLLDGVPTPRLVPAKLRAARQTRRMRAAIWSGAALGAILLAMDGSLTMGRLREANATVDRLQAQIEMGEPALALGHRADQLDLLAALARARATEEVGAMTRLGATARAIAAATPKGIVLEHADLTSTGDSPSCSLTGYIAGDPDSAADVLRAYADALGALPIVDGVELGLTARAEIDGAEVRSFSLEVRLVPLPAWAEDGGR